MPCSPHADLDKSKLLDASLDHSVFTFDPVSEVAVDLFLLFYLETTEDSPVVVRSKAEAANCLLFRFPR